MEISLDSDSATLVKPEGEHRPVPIVHPVRLGSDGRPKPWSIVTRVGTAETR